MSQEQPSHLRVGRESTSASDVIRPKKVLILGSGALKIGEAGEFDYSGSQAIKALREEGIRTILVNPNIATIQTSADLADEVYFLPVNAHFVERVIEREKPDGVLLSFGGQTALNCGIELEQLGVFEKHGVQVLGTPLATILTTEDRHLFAEVLRSIHLDTPRSRACADLASSLAAAEEIGYPVMVRAAFALGGKGSGIAKNDDDLTELANNAFANVSQILVEEYLEGWKEIEYEVVRDAQDNCITVCNMENIDALGIHTGESIVVAPSQTLSDHDYHRLRSISIELIRHLGVVGECNVQFALHPQSDEYRIIEVNARLSRSSALASKATGYPLAFVAAKLALGYCLIDVPNSITKVTASCFEPALDYCVIKMPRWDLKKFRRVSTSLGSEMKSVGEVMSIGRKFEEALQKACRMLGVGAHGLVSSKNHFEEDDLHQLLEVPTEERIFAIGEAFKRGWSVEKVHSLTKITPWFLQRVREVAHCQKQIEEFSFEQFPASVMRRAKELGFSDNQIARSLDRPDPIPSGYQAALDVRDRREEFGIRPVVKQIDTLAAEYPAQTNFLYMTYNGTTHDVEPKDPAPYVVLGGGAYRIGSSVEFDWCAVNAVDALARAGHRTVMINYNPETVSTDYDSCDRLYFEELSLERVLDIVELERSQGVVISVGGQIPNQLAVPLGSRGVKILGTDVDSIDRAENRERFSTLLDELGIDQPEWRELTSIEDARSFSARCGYPVLIRPSYVLSGAAMSVAHSDEEMELYLKAAADVSREHPVVVSKFIAGAKEIELDGVAQNGNVVCYAISEHVENAGVHSGDATMVFPSQRLYLETTRRIKRIARGIAEALAITGPFNIQFIARDNHIKVIECNLRASRSFPFVSKILKENFIDYAVRAMLGEKVESPSKSAFEFDFVGVKAPQFSFSRLRGADPLLGVEMSSTGEVACLGDTVEEAYLKALLSVGFTLPKKGVLLSTGTIESKADFLDSARKIEELGLPIYATPNTHLFLEQNGVESTMLHQPLDHKSPSVIEALEDGRIDLVINVPRSLERKDLTSGYLIRRKVVDYGISMLTNIQAANLLVDALWEIRDPQQMLVKPWSEYS
ncbi:MAG: carbamoyl-phosphate synthase (glutamine-hydrolyzing) large subunit [Planctomycetota bacterium]|nr:carbamoyl-phosphate synthase (glutamine-hydrolyzing) large subunit [Planctomycetota bacterium]